MKQATAMLTMILFLGSASLAAAECAWVLWAKTWGTWASMPQPWDVIGAYQGRDTCQEARLPAFKAYPTSQVEYEKGRWGPPKFVETDAPTYTVTLRWGKEPKHVWYSTQFLCLPDTIDPREKRE